MYERLGLVELRFDAIKCSGTSFKCAKWCLLRVLFKNLNTTKFYENSHTSKLRYHYLKLYKYECMAYLS